MFKFIFKRKNNDENANKFILESAIDDFYKEKHKCGACSYALSVKETIGNFPYFDESLEKARKKIYEIKECNKLVQTIGQTEEERDRFDKSCMDKMHSILENLIEDIRTEFLNNVIN